MAGRPLRFLTMLSLGWVGLRITMLWPGAEPSLTVRMPPGLAARATARMNTRMPVAALPATLLPAWSPRHVGAPRAADHHMTDAQILAAVGIMYFTEVRPSAADNGTQIAPSFPVPIANTPLWSPRRAAHPASRWSLDAWVLSRGEPVSGALAPQLGGAQAGIRIGYFLDGDRRAAAFVRATTPLQKPGVELAAGLQWQPTRAPVAAFAEVRRRAGGEVLPVAGVVGGVYRTPIAGRWRLDGYGQAGVVGAKHVEGFADGQLRLARNVASVGAATIDAGVGAWGGMQRDTSRFDLGPTVGIALPVRAGNFRLSLDWRQRVAGHAAPASGPALTLAAGF